MKALHDAVGNMSPAAKHDANDLVRQLRTAVERAQKTVVSANKLVKAAANGKTNDVVEAWAAVGRLPLVLKQLHGTVDGM